MGQQSSLDCLAPIDSARCLRMHSRRGRLSELAAIFVVAIRFIALELLESLNAKRHGCKRAIRYPNREPFLGLELFWRVRKVNQLGEDPFSVQRLHNTCRRTFEAE